MDSLEANLALPHLLEPALLLLRGLGGALPPPALAEARGGNALAEGGIAGEEGGLLAEQRPGGAHYGVRRRGHGGVDAVFWKVPRQDRSSE